MRDTNLWGITFGRSGIPNEERICEVSVQSIVLRPVRLIIDDRGEGANEAFWWGTQHPSDQSHMASDAARHLFDFFIGEGSVLNPVAFLVAAEAIRRFAFHGVKSVMCCCWL